MTPAIERTLHLLAEWPDRSVALPLLGQALKEPVAASWALRWLLSTPEGRGAREVVRHWHTLASEMRLLALEEGEIRLRQAVLELARAPRSMSRQNAATLLAHWSSQEAPFAEGVEALCSLSDDPSPQTFHLAREALLSLICRQPQRIEDAASSSPLIEILDRLIRRWREHRDRRVIELLLYSGRAGHRCLGEELARSGNATGAILVATLQEGSPTCGELRAGALRSWLSSSSAATRDGAREALRRARDPEFLAACSRWLDEDPPPVGRLLAHLSRLPWWRIDSGAIASLTRKSQEQILEWIAASPSVPGEKAARLFRLLPHLDAEIRNAPEGPIAGLEPDLILAQCRQNLASPEAALRIIAFSLLPVERLGDILDLVIAGLSDPVQEVRQAACERLQGHGFNLWVEHAEGRSEPVLGEAIEVLSRFDRLLEGEIDSALESSDRRLRMRAIHGLRLLGHSANHEPRLQRLAQEQDPFVRATAARALGQVGGGHAMATLRTMLEDGDTRVVANAAQALDEIGDPLAKPWLEGISSHSNPRIQAHALLGLCRLGDPQAESRLEEMTWDDEETRRSSGSWALAQLDIRRQG